jgi:hypothetical protein
VRRQDEVKRFTREKWFWAVQEPVAVALAVFAPGAWKTISIVYLVVISIHSLVKGAGAQEQAAKAGRKSEEVLNAGDEQAVA